MIPLIKEKSLFKLGLFLIIFTAIIGLSIPSMFSVVVVGGEATLTKAVDKTAANYGEALTYTLTPRYSGNELLTNVKVYDTIPEGTDYLADSATAGGIPQDESDPLDGSIDSITWNLGSNTPGIEGNTGQQLPGATNTLLIRRTATKNPVGDTYIRDNESSRNFGRYLDYFRTSRPNDSTRNGLLYFDLSEIPAGATINSATLNLYVLQARNSCRDNIYRMITPWTEGDGYNQDPDGGATMGATWDDAKIEVPGEDWRSSGGSFGGQDYDNSIHGYISPTSTGSKSVDLTSLVREWQNGTYPNYGIVLIRRQQWGESTSDVRYASSEYDVEAKRPSLTVEYTEPSGVFTGTSSLQAGPALVQAGDEITVSMTLTNNSAAAMNNVAPAISSTGAEVTPISGPLPAQATVPAGGSATFQWVYEADEPEEPGSVTFTATAANSSVSWSQSTSNSVLVSPPLTYQVEVKDGAPGPIANTAWLMEPNVAPGSGRESNQVETIVLNNFKQVDKAEAAYGDTLTYTMTPRYDGDELLTDVKIYDRIPAGTNYLADSATAGGSPLDESEPADGVIDSITWNLGSNMAGVPGQTVQQLPGTGGSLVIRRQSCSCGSDSVFDTYIRSDSPNSNYGTSTTLCTRPGSNRKNTLLRFDLSEIPAGATITEATLNLYVTASQYNVTDTIYRMLTPWTEGGASWNDSNGSSYGDWASGTFGAGDYNSNGVGTITPSSTGTKSVDLTNLARGWQNGTYDNNGIVLISTTGCSCDVVQYASSEYSTISKRPSLTVNYTISSGAPAGTSVLRAGPSLVQAGDEITVSMTLTNNSAAAMNNVAPAISSTGAGVTLISGPTPGQGTVPPNGEVTLQWVYRANELSAPGAVTFAASATNGTYTWSQAISNSVLVSPPLTFQVTVNEGAASPITNTAWLREPTIYPGDGMPSEIVETVVTGPAPHPEVSIKKEVWDGAEWQDANTAPGPEFLEDVVPRFRITLTNTGNVNLENIVLTDKNNDEVIDTRTISLEAGETVSIEVEAAEGSAEIGENINEARAEMTYGGIEYTAVDIAYYKVIQARPSLKIEKYVSVDGGDTWIDADRAPGPELIPGIDPRFKFWVKNNGNVPISDVVINDDCFGHIATVGTLNPNEVYEKIIVQAYTPGDPGTTGPLNWIDNQNVSVVSITASNGDKWDFIPDADAPHEEGEWVEDEYWHSGYWYYQGDYIAPGETKKFRLAVALDEEKTGNEYQNATFYLQTTFEAIQRTHEGAFDIWGVGYIKGLLDRWLPVIFDVDDNRWKSENGQYYWDPETQTWLSN